jgi:hypothetical protein
MPTCWDIPANIFTPLILLVCGVELSIVCAPGERCLAGGSEPETGGRDSVQLRHQPGDGDGPVPCGQAGANS